MIKVLHIFGKMNRGGAEMRTIELMPLLSKKGVHFDFCTLMDGNGLLDNKIRNLGGEVYPCPLKPSVFNFPKRFLQLLERSDYDIVHSHVHYASGLFACLSYKAGIKGRIVHFRNTTDGKSINLSRKFYRAMMHRMIDKYATSILAVCRGAMEYSWNFDWKRDPRTCVIYNGLDLSEYCHAVIDRERLIAELGIPTNSKLAINVARFEPSKAHDVLLDAAAKVAAIDSKVHFLLVGNGTLHNVIKKKALGLNIADHVHFLGIRNDVPRLLKSSDCFVFPSRWEGLPGSILEAVAANLPIIASDLPGIREIAEHTDLIRIVGVDDKNALANGILRIITHVNLGSTRKKSFPEEFDLHNCAEKLYEVYLKQIF